MKRCFSVLLSLVLLCSLFGFSASALEDTTVFYLDYGDVVISDDGITGYDIDGNLRDSFNYNGYTITQLNPDQPLARSVTVTSGEHNIELLNINIRRSNSLDFAVGVLKTATANITISGVNHIHPGTYRAGIDIATGATVVIEGDGVLYTESEMQAGIGGGNGKSNGTLTINSGTIYATGGIDGYSAGIGGGTAGTGGNITINGGYIVATGGYCAAGIGGGNTRGGGNITINGGVITAAGGDSGAGIGGGFVGNGGNIVINGGSVKAVAGSVKTSGEHVDNIGNGEKCKTEFAGVKNSAGEDVSLVTKDIQDFEKLYYNGIYTAPITENHPDDTLHYFYTSSSSVLTAYMSDKTVEYYCSSDLDPINPFAEGFERFDNSLICDSSLSAQAENGFTANGNLLYFGNIIADIFTPVLRGDLNGDGILDGRDAVIARCAGAELLDDPLTLKLADKNKDGAVDDGDALILESLGLFIQPE
ncbi:MAG: hypothetical protein IJU45_05980 [Clostridia bacterium]|nr:hypothetical protein [Clostridia bacterium]